METTVGMYPAGRPPDRPPAQKIIYFCRDSKMGGDVLINCILFMIAVVFYYNLIFYYKKSEDLEIYEMDYKNNNHLQIVCDLKQPILFSSSDTEIADSASFLFQNLDLEKIKSTHEIYIKDNIVLFSTPKNDKISETDGEKEANQKYLEDEHNGFFLPFESGKTFIKSDSKSRYYSEENYEFLEEENFIKYYEKMDVLLKPNFIVNTNYDFCFGSKDCITPFKFHRDYRHFFMIDKNKISVKLASFKNSKYLDYSRKNNTSYINVWNPSSEKDKSIVEKIKLLEFDVLPGMILHIPSYWWFSIKYHEKSVIYAITYNSAMNLLANLF